MCWNGDNRPIVAKKDIPVFKIGLQKKSNKKIYSYFQFMEYELGITYRSDITKYNSFCGYGRIIIVKGLHSYSMNVDVIKYDISYLKVIIKRNGNEKFLERYMLTNTEEYDLVVMECVIPKGSIYYQNEDGEVVSDSLIINKTTKFKTNQL